MSHRVVFEIEHHDETAQAAASPNNYGLIKAMLEYEMNWPRVSPSHYVFGGMRGEMLEWLNTNPALRGNNELGFDQQRTGDLSFTRSLYLEFENPRDAMLFRLTWGCTTNNKP